MIDRTEPRTPLSRDRVIDAALTLVDDGGIQALSMRRLADELGVKAMSLYNHVANKDDVLDGIVDAAMSEIAAPPAGAEWKTQVREVAISAHETLLRHPWVVGLGMRQKPGRGLLRYGDMLLSCFRTAGFSKELTYHAYHVIEGYILGYTTQVLNYRAVDEKLVDDIVARFTRGEFAQEYPHFTEHALQHFEPEPGLEDVNGYELGLDLILDGLERLRDDYGTARSANAQA
jgi:AcrR family transcriptional regulator